MRRNIFGVCRRVALFALWWAAACQPTDRPALNREARAADNQEAGVLPTESGDNLPALPPTPDESNSEETPPPVTSLEPNGTNDGQSRGSCTGDAGACASNDAGPIVCEPTGPRDCNSDFDHDCDGQPDSVLDAVCVCKPGTVEPCDEHPGIDGQGQCRAGARTCIIGEGNLTSNWGACEGSVAPSGQDSCTVTGDDSDCNGAPNTGCACVDEQTQPCGSNTDVGPCQIGTSTCVNGVFGQCVGAVAPAARDTCAPGDDANCNGIPNEGCSCVNGETRACGVNDVGACQLGTETCANGTFGACQGAVSPGPRDCGSPQDNDCDGRPDNSIDNTCECNPGSGNGLCSTDPNNTRCNSQGQCVPCQADQDCSLVPSGRSLCGNGQCVAPVPIAVWEITGNGASLPVSSTVPDVAGLAVTRSQSFTAGPALEIFANLDWPRDDASIDLSQYFDFGVTVEAGRSLTYESLEFAISCQSCADASANWQIRSSLDNFTTVLASGSAASMSPSPAVLRPNIRSIGTRSGTVRFRFYAFNVRAQNALTSGQESPIVGLRGAFGDGTGSNLLVIGGLSNL
jgi:hypothetical protein